MTSPYRFRPCHRLHAGAQFDRVYREGRRAGDGLFAVNALPNPCGHARLGMSVSYRTVGNAVSRNRIRRTIREMFRLQQAALPPLDFVVTSRPGARGAERPVLLTSLERLFAEAIRKAANANAPAPAPRH